MTLPEGEFCPTAGFMRPGKKGDALRMANDLEDAMKAFPAVWHYSGYSMERKSRMWHTFWKTQWESIRQGTAQENGIFKYLGENPTDEEWEAEEKRLLDLFITYEVRAQPPAIMKNWKERFRAPKAKVESTEW